MSEPTPAPAPASGSLAAMLSELKTFALGFVIAMAMAGQLKIPVPSPVVPTPSPVVPTPVPVPIPPTPTPVPVPVPAVTDFFRVGQAYGKALAAAYGDAWDRNFQVKPGDDLDSKLAAVKSDWDSARAAAFGAAVAPEFDKLAPDRKAVDQPAADALNKARADFTNGLRNSG